MTTLEKICGLLLMLALLANTLWIDYLTSVNFSAWEFYQEVIHVKLDQYLPKLISIWLFFVFGMFLFPILSYTLPILMFFPCKGLLEKLNASL